MHACCKSTWQGWEASGFGSSTSHLRLGRDFPRLLRGKPQHRPPGEVGLLYLLTFSPQLEVSRYNTLIGLVRGALADLAGALKGSIIMSLEIEDTLEAVRKASIPLPWLLQVNLKIEEEFSKRTLPDPFLYTFIFWTFLSPQGYPSDRTLPSYIKNLAQRVDFFNRWIEVSMSSISLELVQFIFMLSPASDNLLVFAAAVRPILCYFVLFCVRPVLC